MKLPKTEQVRCDVHSVHSDMGRFGHWVMLPDKFSDYYKVA